MELSADLVGRRMVLRCVVPDTRGPSGGPALTDIVGRVLSYAGGVVVVERRDGSLVDVHTDRVVAAKQVPDGVRRVRPRPAMDFSPDEVSRICTRGWPPLIGEPLGQWELRAAGGFTGRANSVAVHGEPGLPFAHALDAVVAFYRRHDLPPRAQVVVGSAWESRFESAGWSGVGGSHDHAVVQVADLRDVLARCAPADSRVVIDDTLSEGWLQMLERGTGFPSDAVRHVLASPPTVGFARIGDPVVAIARVVVTGEWAGLSCVHTAPDLRRRGLAKALMDASMHWAGDHGADKVYLQTMHHNHAALTIYPTYGFAEHHTYRYLAPAPR